MNIVIDYKFKNNNLFTEPQKQEQPNAIYVCQLVYKFR